MCHVSTDVGGKKKQLYHGCPPVHQIIHWLELEDYLHVQMDKSWYSYYIITKQDWSNFILVQQGCKIIFLTHSPCRTSGWNKLLTLMALSLAFNNWSYMCMNLIDKHLLFFSLNSVCVFFYKSLSAEASFFLSLIISSPFFLPLKQSTVSLWHIIWAANVVLFDRCWCKQKCDVHCLNLPAIFEDLCGQTPHIDEALLINSTERRELTATGLKMCMCSCNSQI